MTTAGRVPTPAASLCESPVTQPGASRQPALRRPVAAFAQKLTAIYAISCAIALAGCANKTAAPGFEANPIQEPADRQVQLRVRRPDRALLKPQPAPDCELRESGVKPVDSDQWARLKLDYQRQCYQRAEEAVRKRLRLLQASSTCEIEPVQHSSPTVR